MSKSEIKRIEAQGAEPQVVDKRRFADKSELVTDPQVLATAEFETREFSPSSDPNKPVGMDFATAIQQVIEGKRVTRLEWGNPEIWLMMFVWSNINPKTPTGKYLTIHHADGAMNPLAISDGDLAGDDWVVVV